MTQPQPFLDDGDVRLYHGDVLDVLRGMDADSVDCVVTSPPYWGLRDYGTGAWEGGDEGCDHKQGRDGSGRADGVVDERGQRNRDGAAALTRETCRCGARRVDAQLGLEPTPDQYVTRMVEVFREVRRVLCPHGTCWVNLGDSYASTAPGTRNGSGTGLQSKDEQIAMRGDWRKSSYPIKPKDLVGIPWRVAFALQADGWWLRSDIVWAKPNPMPESVTDRPTKSHEYVFLLTKQPRYFFDQEAVREPHTPDGRQVTTRTVGDGSHDNYQEFGHEEGRERWPGSGRNVRSVWTIATQPYPEAHFATYPEELVRRCVLAGCPERVCRTCGKASERIVEVDGTAYQRHKERTGETWRDLNERHREQGKAVRGTGKNTPGTLDPASRSTTGWSDCGHNNWRPGLVLDPFAGSGTTCKVARDHGRHSVGIDLNADYLALAARRLQQLSLLTAEAHASQ